MSICINHFKGEMQKSKVRISKSSAKPLGSNTNFTDSSPSPTVDKLLSLSRLYFLQFF
jgi:hypothetical protein